MIANDLLGSSHSTLPVQLPVGKAPQTYLNELGDSAHAASLEHLKIAPNAPLTLAIVRTIARSSEATALAKYACIMAWCGQRVDHFRASSRSPDLERLIVALHASRNSQQADFGISKEVCNHIPGLGISFYNKLLFFLRPVPDAYFSVQWTAKGVCLLFYPRELWRAPLYKTGFARDHDLPIPQALENFCLMVDQTQQLVWSLVHGVTSEQAEMAMLDQSEPDGFWRKFVRINVAPPKAGRLLQQDGESLTQAFDYRSGFVVLKRINPGDLRDPNL